MIFSLRLFFTKIFFGIMLSVLLQAFYYVILFTEFLISREITLYIGAAFYLLSLIICAIIIKREDNPNHKLTWLAIIIIFPIAGSFLYFAAGRKTLSKKIRRRLHDINYASQEILDNISVIGTSNNNKERLPQYIGLQSGYPVCDNTKTDFFSSGEKLFEAIADAMKKAKKYILIEFFIFKRGKSFDTLLEIMRQKAEQGVEVKLIYDNLGCSGKLKKRDIKLIKSFGIQIKSFNNIKKTKNLIVSTHRKIVSIDGTTAFLGGINISDEYMNVTHPHGYWRDNGIKLSGNGAWSCTVMFLRFWFLREKSYNFQSYLPEFEKVQTDTTVQPLSDGPDSGLTLNKNIFIQLISNAKERLYISTPYLLPDSEMISALSLASKSNVDVRILVPHKPDKKAIFTMSKSFYPILLEAGVKIYEYLPGFNHAKTVVSDNTTAYIGSCNVDYRSFYMQFECGAVLYDGETVKNISADYMSALSSSKLITLQQIKNTNIIVRAWRAFLRYFSPMF